MSFVRWIFYYMGLVVISIFISQIIGNFNTILILIGLLGFVIVKIDKSPTKLWEVNIDPISANKKVELEVVGIDNDNIVLEYWKEKTKWWHKLPFINSFRQSQFGSIHLEKPLDFKEGDKVTIELLIEKVKP